MNSPVAYDLACGLVLPASVMDIRLLDAARALIYQGLKDGDVWRASEKPAVWARVAAIEQQRAAVVLSAKRRAARAA